MGAPGGKQGAWPCSSSGKVPAIGRSATEAVYFIRCQQRASNTCGSHYGTRSSLVSVPSSGSRKNGCPAASSQESLPLQPEEVKCKCTRVPYSIRHIIAEYQWIIQEE